MARITVPSVHCPTSQFPERRMNKIYVLGHSKNRFETDFLPCRQSSQEVTRCDFCERSFEPFFDINEHGYCWDSEFGHPNESFDCKHEAFWGAFTMIVSSQARDKLQLLGDRLEMIEAKVAHPNGIEDFNDDRIPSLSPFFWVQPKSTLHVDGVENKIRICHNCGKFSDSPLQVTRIRVPYQCAMEAGAFGLYENRGIAIFVTEPFLLKIESLKI
jgi:hypothetical protein